MSNRELNAQVLTWLGETGRNCDPLFIKEWRDKIKKGRGTFKKVSKGEEWHPNFPLDTVFVGWVKRKDEEYYPASEEGMMFLYEELVSYETIQIKQLEDLGFQDG